MQKISSYLYPNRITLLADLAGFNVEYTNVYQRNIKIYNGVDNVLEFDIKNADQKRIDLATVSTIRLNIMDASGKKLPNSPYTVTPTAVQGIASVTVPSADLSALTPQYLQYSVTAVRNGATIPLYADTRFGAVGKIELIGSATPTTRRQVVYDRFSGEINFMGNVINHSSAIPCKFYEAIPTTTMSFEIDITGFIGTIYVEGTKDSTISVESFKSGTKLQTYTTSVATTSTVSFNNVPINDYNYFRITWVYPDVMMGAIVQSNPYGSVDKIRAI
jgi:hypothetical protein